MECSPNANIELFRATVGGLGLTGIITWAEIAQMPITSSFIDVTSVQFANLDEFLELSSHLDPLHEYSVAWTDCLAKGASLGRGVFMVGNHAAHGLLKVDRRRKRTVPFAPPVSPINTLTLRAFNSIYYHRQPRTERQACISYDTYFYPLDSVLEWNRVYGKAGFQQYQCVVPQASSHDATRALLTQISRSGTGSFLAVLKHCGDLASPGLLSFPLEGTSLALDFPQREAVNRRLFASLNAIVREAGGRLYPAKDAHMSGEDFRSAYPQWYQL